VSGNRPTHKVNVKNFKTGARGDIGSGWFNEETGAIFIKLHPGTNLSYMEQEGLELRIAVFPTDDFRKKMGYSMPSDRSQEKYGAPRGDRPHENNAPNDDDIPF